MSSAPEMRDYVALLGTKGGPAIRPGSTNPASSLLVLNGHNILVDCGLGATRGLVDQGVDLADLDLVFITHLHSDHYLELGPLIHTAWTAGLKRKVTVFGPDGLDDHWQAFLASMDADIRLRIDDEGRPEPGSLVEVCTLAPGKVFERDGLHVTAIRNLHPPLTESFALRFEAQDRAVVFSGDTAYMPEMADFARGADLLVHEAMLEDAVDALCARVGNGDARLRKHILRSHTRAEDAGRVAKDAGVRALALNHLIPSDDPDYGPGDWEQAVRHSWDGKFYQGRDGLKIPIG